jgi:hypothetical protein
MVRILTADSGDSSTNELSNDSIKQPISFLELHSIVRLITRSISDLLFNFSHSLFGSVVATPVRDLQPITKNVNAIIMERIFIILF